MQVQVFNFSKRYNSTKQPTGGYTVDCTLKENTSVFNPVFIFSFDAYSYNYLKWGNRYYYINDITYIANNLYEIRCTIDVMATWRSNILNTDGFVMFSASNYDSGIIDTRLSSKKDITVNQSVLSLFTVARQWIVQYVGSDGNAIGFNDEDNYDKLINGISSTDFFTSFLASPEDYTSKIFNSVTDCIKSAFSLPIQISRGAVKEPVLGSDYLVTTTGYAVPDTTEWSGSINIPWNFSDFRNRSQFTSLLLYLPGYGIQELNPDDFNGKNSISISCVLSNLSGDMIYKIDNVCVCKCNIATPLQIGIINSNGMNAIGSLVSAVANPDRINVANESFNAVLSTMTRSVGSVGMNGGFSSFELESNIILYAISHDTNVEPSSVGSVIGRPLNSNINIGSLNGYCQTSDVSVQCNAPDELKQEINNIMDGGFFIE